MTVFDSSYPEIDHSVFKKSDWSQFYWGIKDAIFMSMPKALGKEVDICMFACLLTVIIKGTHCLADQEVVS